MKFYKIVLGHAYGKNQDSEKLCGEHHKQIYTIDGKNGKK